MRRKIAGVLAILFMLGTGTTAFAAENNGRTPSGIAYSDLEGQIEDYIDVRKETTSSVFVTVFDGTDDIATVIYGDANTKDGIKADADTVYEWGSISKDACVMDDGNGLKTYLSIQRDANGNVIALQHMTGMDFQKENMAFFILKVVFFFLFVLSSLWMFLMLIVHGITLHRFKRTDIWNKKIYQLLAELFTVLASVLIYWLILPPLMGGSVAKGQVVVKCVLIMIFSFMETVVLVLGLSGGRNKGYKGLRQKIGLAVTRISGIIMIASVLYWHFYQFWGC